MTCQHCAAPLPPFALFCGECGRSVSAPAVVPPVVARPVPPSPERSAAAVPETMPWSADTPISADTPPSGALCGACGAAAEPSDLFCGECGHPLPGDTRVIDRLIVEPAPVSAVQPHEPPPQRTPEPELALESPPSAPAPTPPPSAPAPTSLPSAPVPYTESTRLVPRGTAGARFVLQFSTGESYTVLGSGLAGRNPHTEPGEYVDHLVTIIDPGRSVSKTHFEFGQNEGVFWFSDRHSGNGSTIREPGAEPRVCEPGRRYPVVRGTRIDIGEQFVVVS